jgi:hypothetical protein
MNSFANNKQENKMKKHKLQNPKKIKKFNLNEHEKNHIKKTYSNAIWIYF